MAYLSKFQAREVIAKRRKSLSQYDYQKQSLKAVDRAVDVLQKLRTGSPSSRVLLYRAVLEWKEVDLSILERRFRDVQFDYVSHDVAASFPDEHYDVIFVPLLGFNHQGYRLGHGGGWYDKFLASQPKATKIGIGLEVGRINFEPEFHDVPMDYIVTEQRVAFYDRRVELPTQ